MPELREADISFGCDTLRDSKMSAFVQSLVELDSAGPEAVWPAPIAKAERARRELAANSTNTSQTRISPPCKQPPASSPTLAAAAPASPADRWCLIGNFDAFQDYGSDHQDYRLICRDGLHTASMFTANVATFATPREADDWRMVNCRSLCCWPVRVVEAVAYGIAGEAAEAECEEERGARMDLERPDRFEQF